MKRESVEAAKMKYQQAAKDYDAAAESAYPPGTIVNVQLGRATVTLRCTGSRGSWWACPGQLCGVNVKTGKVRTFYADNVIQEASHDE